MSSLISRLWAGGRHLLGDIVQAGNDFLNATGINQAVSRVASIPESWIGHTTQTNLNVLHDNTPIPPPTAPHLDQTPTMSQFLNAANTAYAVKGTPQGMHPFLVKGRQLAITDVASAMSAKVWMTDQHQAVIAFQGTTGGDNLFVNPIPALTGVASDIQVWNQTVSQAQKDALSFTHYAVGKLEHAGIDTNNIFVTGHSLGGIEASYIAQQTGLGGVAFEATGIPSSHSSVGNGSNFVSIVTNGDPVGNYASDTEKGEPFVTSMGPGAKNEFNHYGKVVTLGDPKDTIAMKEKLSHWNRGNFANIASLLKVAPDFAKFHLPGTQAADMGSTLSPHSLTADAIVTAHGPVSHIGHDTIGQIMGTDSHHAPLFGH